MKYFHRTHLPPDQVLAGAATVFRRRPWPGGGAAPPPAVRRHHRPDCGDVSRPKAATTPWSRSRPTRSARARPTSWPSAFSPWCTRWPSRRIVRSAPTNFSLTTTQSHASDAQETLDDDLRPHVFDLPQTAAGPSPRDWHSRRRHSRPSPRRRQRRHAAPEHRPGGEVNLQLPDLNQGDFLGFTGHQILLSGLLVCVLGLLFGLLSYYPREEPAGAPQRWRRSRS